MNFCIDEEAAAEQCRQHRFSLPFANQSVCLDDAGARLVAWLACHMAAAESGPLETDAEYALRMAVFICGCIASDCDSDVQRLLLFKNFLPLVSRYLCQTCSQCRDESSDEEALEALLQKAESSEAGRA
ncbi:MAG: hypothetical protein PVG78_07215 [Desulfobacterales bacterium]|jgi:hypothetical protein